jgi:hypothetical protein
MVTKRRGLLGLIATGLAAVLFPGKSAEARPAGASAAFQGLEGTWVDTTSTASGSQMLVLRTFNTDGTYSVMASNYPLTSPGQGVWERTGDREFAFTHLQLRYDEQRNWLGTTKVSGVIRLNETLDAYTRENVAESLDQQGNVLTTSPRIMGTGRRMRVELLS